MKSWRKHLIMKHFCHKYNSGFCFSNGHHSIQLSIGLKRYAQPAIRYDTRYNAHATIRSAIHLPFLPGKQRLVIPAWDQKHCTPPTTTACAVMMRSGYNNGGLLGVSRCSVFVMNSLILLEYTDCFPWYLVFVSNFGMCYICTVSYRIVLRAYRDMYHSLCIGDILVCRCIVSALALKELIAPTRVFTASNGVIEFQEQVVKVHLFRCSRLT